MNMANGNDISGDWSEWRRHVLLEIKRLNTNMERMTRDISSLRVQSATWGAFGGIFVTLLLTKLIAEV